jgi:hypothetical protein
MDTTMLGVDPHRLDPDERVQLVASIERAKGPVEAAQVRAIAAVAAAYEELGQPAMEARLEIGCVLRLAPVTAADRTQVAVDLVNRFGRTLALLEAGAICYLQAAHVARGTADLDDEHARLVEDRVVPRLPRLTAAETRRAVADAVVKVDPAAAQARAAKAKRERKIDRVPGGDGRTGWFLPMDVVDEGLAWCRVTDLAQKVRKLRAAAGLDDPGLDALRVDIAVDLLLGRDPSDLNDDDVPESPAAPLGRCSCGGKQTAAVMIDLPTLLGMADHPGEVPGYGAVPAEVARAMAADRDLVRWLVDPGTGELLEVGSETYRPSERLQQFIRARDQRCSFPGCGRRAESCEIDHVRNFGTGPHDGKTVRRNLGPLCRQHHNAKTHGLWHLDRDPASGRRTWTSPLGRTYVREAAPLRT